MGTASSFHTLATSCSHFSLPAAPIPSLPPAHSSLYLLLQHPQGERGRSGEHGDEERGARARLLAPTPSLLPAPTSLYLLLQYPRYLLLIPLSTCCSHIPREKGVGAGSMGTRSGEHGNVFQLPHPRYLMLRHLSTSCSNTLATFCS
jgi:hypothetical protein